MSGMKRLAVLLLFAFPLSSIPVFAQAAWSFAVSGDSRNCGDVVMPAIAQRATSEGDVFYWHLGDLRALIDFDEDFLAQPKYLAARPTIQGYTTAAWPDFIEHQLAPFGNLPVYLTIGNHELVAPKSRDEYIAQFADWLDTPELKAQRLKDKPADHVLKTYYHWIRNGVDFISLDNASGNTFDQGQVDWAQSVIAADEKNPGIKTIVAGSHEALPNSKSAQHSMADAPNGLATGNALYAALLHARDSGKKVYILASHSHFYLANVFDTPDHRAKNDVLPGWVVGTAGAHRYLLPPGIVPGPDAQTNVYGYLTGAVAQDGTIAFTFHQFSEDDLQNANRIGYDRGFVHQCFIGNHD